MTDGGGPSPSHLRWAKGGAANIEALSGVHVTVVSSVSAAPGTPLTGELEGGAQVRVKVARCRRVGDTFRIEGRLVDASRDVLTKLAALTAPRA